jgi:hypothetical protein
VRVDMKSINSYSHFWNSTLLARVSTRDVYWQTAYVDAAAATEKAPKTEYTRALADVSLESPQTSEEVRVGST